MSVVFSIRGYKKDPAFITGRIRPLNAYEVDLEAANKFGLLGMEWPSFYSGIHSFQAIRGNKINGLWDEWEMYPEMWYFMPLAMDHFSGFGLKTVENKALGIMFDAAPVRILIKKLNDNIDGLYRCFPADFENYYEEEKQNLIILGKLLTNPLMEDAIVSCVWS